MLPRVILHNSVSLDGSLTGFEPDMEMHYRIAGSYSPRVHLIGSKTVTAGTELYGNGSIPPEDQSDFIKPERTADIPFWAVVDSRGSLKGLLHTCRRFEYCRDVIALVSETTPADYLTYLNERNYDYLVAGQDQVDLKLALEKLNSHYNVDIVFVDAGRILGNLLVEKGLVSEISLLIHPLLVGKSGYSIFGNLGKSCSLQLIRQEKKKGGLIWMAYRIKGNR